VEETPVADSQLQLEEQTVALRKKELKAMGAAEIKEIVLSKSLAAGKKEDMIHAIVQDEANGRAQQRAHEAKIRAVLVCKKEDLESRSAQELKELCSAKGIAGVLAKPLRIEKLLHLWQEEGGIDEALAEEVRKEREAELSSLGTADLQKRCREVGVSPFITEVMIERLLRHEQKAGRFKRPMEEECKEESAAVVEGDLVQAFVKREANRKKEEELKKQRDQAAAAKRKELRGMSADELKKALCTRGLESTGKKEDLVETLFQAMLREEQITARRADLKALAKEELKKQATSRGLEVSGKEAMVEAILAWEAQRRAARAEFDAKVLQVFAKKREDLEAKSGNELKEMCASKGLKAGSSKEDRVERLLELASSEGDLDEAIQEHCIADRKSEMLAMDQCHLEKLCTQYGVNPFVKEVLVERLLASGRG